MKVNEDHLWKVLIARKDKNVGYTNEQMYKFNKWLKYIKVQLVRLNLKKLHG